MRILYSIKKLLQLSLLAIALTGIAAVPAQAADSKVYLPLISKQPTPTESPDFSWHDGSGACLFVRSSGTTAKLIMTANESLSPVLYLVTDQHDVYEPLVIEMKPQIIEFQIDENGAFFYGYTVEGSKKIGRCGAQYEHQSEVTK